MKVRWAEPALQQLHEAYDYVQLDKPDAAERLIARIEVAVDRLRAFPQMGKPSMRPKARGLAIPGTPFVVVYRVGDNAIDIVALFHRAQNWRSDS